MGLSLKSLPYIILFLGNLLMIIFLSHNVDLGNSNKKVLMKIFKTVERMESDIIEIKQKLDLTSETNTCPSLVEGIWIKVFNHNTGGGLFTPEDVGSKNPNDPSADLYSILDLLEKFRSSDGAFHFKICWPELVGINNGDGCNEWKQKSNPYTESTSITDFQSINLSFPYRSTFGYYNSWVGIGKDNYNGGYTFISDSPNEGKWYTAIGSYVYWPFSSGVKTIPGPKNPSVSQQYPVNLVELYVKIN